MSDRRRAVFLDRDGVLVSDEGLAGVGRVLVPLEGVAEALRRLDALGYALVVVTNQAVVARGLVTEDELASLHHGLARAIEAEGGPTLTTFQVCPHHPHAQVERYRIECLCRKPRPGLLLDAARILGLDLGQSWMVGDRASDVAAGRRAGCRTLLLRGPATGARAIVGAETLGNEGVPHHACDSLLEAAQLIESKA